METARPMIAIGLVVLGFASLLIGIALLAWSAVQKSARAGAAPGNVSAWAGLLRALASLVNALAKYWPNGAARIGGALVILGIFLIAAALRL